MKVIRFLLLFVCLLFTLNCKSSQQIFKCVLNNAEDSTLSSFMSSFKLSPSVAYGLLNLNKGKLINAINECK